MAQSTGTVDDFDDAGVGILEGIQARSVVDYDRRVVMRRHPGVLGGSFFPPLYDLHDGVSVMLLGDIHACAVIDYDSRKVLLNQLGFLGGSHVFSLDEFDAFDGGFREWILSLRHRDPLDAKRIIDQMMRERLPDEVPCTAEATGECSYPLCNEYPDDEVTHCVKPVCMDIQCICHLNSMKEDAHKGLFDGQAVWHDAVTPDGKCFEQDCPHAVQGPMDVGDLRVWKLWEYLTSLWDYRGRL